MKKIIQTNDLSKEQKASMLTRIITAVVLAAIVLPCIFLGNWFFFGLIALVCFLCAYELVRITPLEKNIKIAIYIITIILTVAITYYMFLKNIILDAKNGEIELGTYLYKNIASIDLSEMLIMFAAAVYFVICFSIEKFKISYVFYFLSMVIVIPLGLQSFLYLRFLPFTDGVILGKTVGLGFGGITDTTTVIFKYFQSAFLLLYVAIGVFLNDIGAYFIGMLFGKHKMNPRISPKKTWEGFVGGIVFSIVFSMLFALLLSAGGYPILPMFDHHHWYFVLVVSILLPIFGDIGDFIFSAIKRHYEVKDFSRLLPGHGGMLDRIDSILFAAGLVAGVISFIQFIGAY